MLTLPQVIENVCAVAPNINGAILPEALIIETVHLLGKGASTRNKPNVYYYGLPKEKLQTPKSELLVSCSLVKCS